jgi:hypothetical protein
MSEHSLDPLETADSSNHGNHLDGLCPRQNRALIALLAPPVFTEDSVWLRPPRPFR